MPGEATEEGRTFRKKFGKNRDQSQYNPDSSVLSGDLPSGSSSAMDNYVDGTFEYLTLCDGINATPDSSVDVPRAQPSQPSAFPAVKSGQWVASKNGP